MTRLPRWLATTVSLLAFATTAAAGPFKIGLGAPLSGADAIFGNQLRLGVQTAVADLNEAGGFLGQRAEVVARDDGNDIKKGTEVAKAFVAQKLPVVVGHFSSAVTVPASAAYAEAGMLDITPSAMAPLVTERDLATVFRTCGREDAQADVAARYLLSRRVARVAILHDRTSGGKALADAVRKAMAAAGVKDVFYGSLEKGTRDFGGLVSRLKSSGAQIAFWGGGATEAGLLVRQLREANAKTSLMGGIAMASDDFAQLGGPAADGTLMVFPEDPKTRPSAAKLLAELRDNDIEPDGYTFYAYAAVQVIQQAAAAAHSLEPAKLAETMHSGQTFKTVIGDFAFDKQGDPTLSDLAVYVWHKGATGRMTFDDQAKS